MSRRRSNKLKSIVIQRGSARVLIYPETYRKKVGKRWRKYRRFTVSHYRTDNDTRNRLRQSFADLTSARFEAERIATAIANGEADVLRLTAGDRSSYLHAVESLRPLNIPLHVAVAEYVEARRHAGAGLITAAKQYSRSSAFISAPKKVGDLVVEFIAAKEQDGMSVRYIQSLRSHLNRFSGSYFAMPIGAVTGAQMDDWLRRTATGARTRNNIRLSLVSLFNFAKSRGYVSKATESEADHIPKAKDRGGRIGIFSPDELAQILIGNDKKPSPLDAEGQLYIAIGAFTGLRSAELIRLEWQDINFARGNVEVGKHKSKTATRRLVPIADNLTHWLAPYRDGGSSGQVFASEHAADRAIARVKEAGFEWPNNVLRHSFATYRLALCGDAPRVSLEMGNSPAMLFRNYRELADEKDAADWFGIVPTLPANVVRISGRKRK